MEYLECGIAKAPTSAQIVAHLVHQFIYEKRRYNIPYGISVPCSILALCFLAFCHSYSF